MPRGALGSQRYPQVSSMQTMLTGFTLVYTTACNGWLLMIDKERELLSFLNEIMYSMRIDFFTNQTKSSIGPLLVWRLNFFWNYEPT